MPRPVQEQIVVITGASSGIGRETALRFAQRGATVVLAARNEPALREVAEECGSRGGRAIADVVDVSDWRQVERLANQTVERFGRIDTWINNAAVSEYATVEQMAIEEIERIIQVDLMGQIYGIKAVLPHMRREDRGTIICVGSVVGDRAVPLQSAYCASKYGIKGFVESLRMELDHAGSGIAVTLIKPASINTPFFTNARSKMGVKPAPIPPVYEPSVVAEAIVFASEHPRREMFAGGAGKMFEILQRVSPQLADWFMTQNGRMFRKQMTDEPDTGRDNMFEPILGPGQVRGDWRGRSKSTSLYTRVFERHPSMRRLAAGAVAVGAAALIGSLGRRTSSGAGDARAQFNESAGRVLQAVRDQQRLTRS